jgi:hypothetical protein
MDKLGTTFNSKNPKCTYCFNIRDATAIENIGILINHHSTHFKMAGFFFYTKWQGLHLPK